MNSTRLSDDLFPISSEELTLEELESACQKTAIFAWSQKKEICPEPPQIIYLCPTNVCNHRCCTCGYGSMRRGRKPDGSPQRGYMDMVLFRKIVSELPRGFRRVYLQKTGESLLHPRIGEMMSLLKVMRPEYDRAMHTNASVLTPELARTMLENLTFISLSIFAFDRETYRRAHAADHFERVMANIAMFHDAWDRMDSPPKVYFDVVRNTHNYELNDEQIFSFLQERFPKFNVGIHFPFNFQGLIKEYDNKIFSVIDSERMPSCIHPWDMMAIFWDGLVGYCVGESLEKATLGDLRQQTVMEAWNGSGYREFRRLAAAKDFSALRDRHIHCGSCNWNFALKSQVLTTLCMSTRHVVPCPSEQSGQPLFSSQDMLRVGLLNYARGEMAEALKNIAFAEIVSRDEALRQRAGWWKQRVLDVLLMRKDLEYWEDLLREEGLSFETVHISKYSLAREQIPMTEGIHCNTKSGTIVKRDTF
jgi:hypothetical protein